MRKNSLMKRVAVATMAAAIAITGLVGFASRNVYANDGSYNEVTQDISVRDITATGVVTSEYANIRDGASTTSPILKKVVKGTRLDLTGRVQKSGQDTKWFRVYVDLEDGGQSAGYISNLTFDMEGETTSAATMENAENKAADTRKTETCVFTVEKANKTMKVAQDVWVRKGPKTTYDTMGSLKEGKTVQVTGQVFKHGKKACWVQVNFNGKTGYVCTDYLK